MKLFGNAQVIQIAAGEFGYHSLFLTGTPTTILTILERNELFICGYGGFCTLGQGDSRIQPIPVRVLHDDWIHDKITSISAGQWHSCITTQKKNCYSW